jgi:hypothetical protein
MCKPLDQRVKFKADPATVYDLLADSRKHSAVTGDAIILLSVRSRNEDSHGQGADQRSR